MCRRLPKPACRAFNSASGSASWRPKTRRSPIVDLLNSTITGILSRPDIKEAWEKQGATPMVMTQPEFAAFMAAEIAKWAKVIKDNHIALIN